MQREDSHKSRTAWTADALRERIIRSQYKPGERLRIDQIGKDLDASPGAVREALSRLSAEGLVISEPQRGFVVTPISRKDLIDLTEVRIRIECLCLVDTIRHGDLEWEGRVLSLQHQLRQLVPGLSEPDSPTAARFHKVHLEFHSALTEFCENTWWLKLRSQLFLQSERYRRLSGPFDEEGRDISAEHDAIAGAAISRDTKEAEALMVDHLSRTTSILLKSRIPFSDTAPDSVNGSA